MATVLIVLAIVCALAAGGFALLVARAKLVETRRAGRSMAKINAAVARLDSDPDAARLEMGRLAANPELRSTLYSTLASNGKSEHFPGEFLNQEALAESDLVFWLCHPNELQVAPDEIQLMARISKTLPDEAGPARFFVFRFRVNTPHWASERGWMAGIAGPYSPGGDLQTHARGTFSELAPYDSLTPADHVDYLLSQQGSTWVTRTRV
jgi:hypothetical protein